MYANPHHRFVRDLAVLLEAGLTLLLLSWHVIRDVRVMALLYDIYIGVMALLYNMYIRVMALLYNMYIGVMALLYDMYCI